MTGRNDRNKQALLKNRPKIVQNLENPDDVAAYLYGIGLFTDEMQAAVVQEPERERKNRKILDTLTYRGKNVAKGLHDAFLETSNKDLAELLAPYVEEIQKEDNKLSPKKWPPLDEDQKAMKKDTVTRITDLKSPHYIHEYTSSKVYKMRNRIRGKVFIINNETFDDGTKLSFRKGSNVDANNLECLFTQLQFEVVIEKDQSAKAMIDFLKTERDKVNWYDMECVVLIIMSHGGTDGIYGTDGKLIQLKDMTDIFDSLQCPGLNEKPRLVFVQACRGSKPSQPTGPLEISDIRKDSATLHWSPPKKDGGSPVTAYVIEKQDKKRKTWSTVQRVDGSINKLQVDKLVDGTEYLFRVRAENRYILGEPLEAEKAIIPKSPFSNTETGSTGHGIQVKDGADQEDKVVEPMKAVNLADGGQDILDAVPSKQTEVTEKTVHSAADFLIANATPEGTPAYRNVDVGSWFLNAIVWTFKYHAHKEEISQLLIMVNNLVSQGRAKDRTNDGLMTVSEVKSTLRKQLFFFPGVYDDPPKFV